MKAVILSAGEGKRLRPLTNKIPKVMLSLSGKPLLEHLIILCQKHGVDEVFLNLYHLPDVITNHFRSRELGIKVSWVVMEKLINAAEALLYFRENLKEDFLVLYGDVASRLDLTGLMKYHKHRKALATIVLHPSNHPIDSDLAEIDSNNRIIRFHIKPHENIDYKNIYLCNAGTIAFSPKIFQFIEKGWNKEDSLSHSLLTKIINERRDVFGFVTDDYMKDIGTPERYAEISKEYCL
mgnify:CR=1 FL=1